MNSRSMSKSSKSCVCLQYRDLPHTTLLAVTVWEVSEGRPLQPLGGATMRLKTGLQRLQLWQGQTADPAWPSSTPGKLPVASRGKLG